MASAWCRAATARRVSSRGAPAAGFVPGGMEDINDRFQDAVAVIAPSRAVEGHRELAVSVGVDLSDTVHQLRYLRAGAHPLLCGVLDGRADPAAAVTQHSCEQPFAATEVMVDTGVGYADALGDGAYFDRPRPGLDQQFLSGVED